MFSGLGIENFRVFKNMTEFDFAPITLLTGANNSGKSSVIKALLLLKNSLKSNLEKLDFKGNDHKLGSFDIAKNKDAQKEKITFKLKFRDLFIEDYSDPIFYYLAIQSHNYKGLLTGEDENFLFSSDLFMTYEQNNENAVLVNSPFPPKNIVSKRDSTQINNFEDFTCIICRDLFFSWIEHSCKLMIEENTFEFYIKDMIKNYINEEDFFKLDISPFVVLPSFYSDLFKKNKKQKLEKLQLHLFLNLLKKTYDSIISNSKYRIDKKSLFWDYSEIKESLIENHFFLSKEENIELVNFIENISSQNINETPTEAICKSILIKMADFWDTINFFWKRGTVLRKDMTEHSITDIYFKLDFISASRANTQRIYQDTSQGTVFNELINQYLEFNFNEKEENANFVNKWLQKFGIGDKIAFDRIKGYGNVVEIIKGDALVNLADLGFGITQLIPLLMKIAICEQNSILMVEEPENSLHPNFQAQLADMFWDAYKTLGIRFIIETHSEYMIRKLQVMTKRGDISGSDSVIYYFKNPETLGEEETNVNKITIDENGDLNGEFGDGFMDEAESLAWDLFNTSKKRMS